MKTLKRNKCAVKAQRKSNMLQRTPSSSYGKVKQKNETWNVECFNNKIKLVFIILIWTLIRQTNGGECRTMPAEDNSSYNGKAVYDNHNNNKNDKNSNSSNLYEQLDINNAWIGDDDNEVVKPIYSVAADATAAAADVVGTKRNDANDKHGAIKMAGDQFGVNDETLKAASSSMIVNDGDGRKASDEWGNYIEQQQRRGESEHERERERKRLSVFKAKADSLTDKPFITYNSDITHTKAANITSAQNEARAAVADSAISQKMATLQATTIDLSKPTAKGVMLLADARGQKQEQKRVASPNKRIMNQATQALSTPAPSHASETKPKEPRARRVRAAAEATTTRPPISASTVAADALQQQLIYEFAIKYKNIQRVTFFTCRRRNENANGGGKSGEGESGGRRSAVDNRVHNNFAKQMADLNMQRMMQEMPRLHDTEAVAAGEEKLRRTATAGRHDDNTNKFKTSKKTDAAMILTNEMTGGGGGGVSVTQATNARKLPASVEYSTSKSDGTSDMNARTGKKAVSTGEATKVFDERSRSASGSGSAKRKPSTYNTTNATTTATMAKLNMPAAAKAAGAAALALDLLIKVVHIDQLINKRPNAANNKFNSNKKNDKNNKNSNRNNNNNNNNNNSKYNCYAQQQQRQQAFSGDDIDKSIGNPSAFRGGSGSVHSTATDADADAGEMRRNVHWNANWLAQVLRDDGHRQLVVLNLACGAASRRLLEMASNQALFNSTYHWLLIEDYAFNRKTGNVDDDNDEYKANKKNKNNGKKNGNNNGKNNDINKSYNHGDDVNEELENNDDESSSSSSKKNDKITQNNNSNNKYESFAADNFYQQKLTFTQANLQQSKKKVADESEMLVATTSTASTAASTLSAAAAAAIDSNTITAFAAGNASFTFTNNVADNMEIIEKFLEKINININTELILAKRHTRRIRDVSSYNDNNKQMCAAAAAAVDDDPLMSSTSSMGSECTLSGNSESAMENDNNKSIQQEDYYQLYDVWSPGLQYGGQLNISEIGYFALDDGLQIALWYRRSTTITRRMDMKMARIRCLIVITNKNLTDTLEHYLTTRYDTHLDSMNRFNFALLSHVRELFNFSFALSKTSTWGYLKNGKFDGMIGALVRKQADIGGSPIFFRIERAKVIDYTTRTWVARPCFIFRHPRSTKKDRNVFLQPFSNKIWILLGFCGVFTVCFLWLLTTMERRFEAVGVVSQLGQRRVNMNIRAANAWNAIDGNDELLCAHCFSTRTTTAMPQMAVTTTKTTTTGSTMHCTLDKNKLKKKQKLKLKQKLKNNAVHERTKVQAKQKLEKFVKHNKVEENLRQEDLKDEELQREMVHCVSFGHYMFGCGIACRGGQACTTTNNAAAQQQQRISLFFESMLFYVSSICQQGLTYSTNFFSGRCIVITSLLFAFAIYQFYSASIVGTLLMEKPKTIRTLRDLIHSSLEVGIEDIPYNRDYFLRTNDPVAIELYAKKVTSPPTTSSDTHSAEKAAAGGSKNATLQRHTVPTEMPDVQKVKVYRDILHSHEMGAHAKTNQASNWYDPEYGVNKIRRGKFAFHVDVATAYKIIADKFTEKEICDLTEIQLFPPQKMVSIVQKGSPLRKMITYGLRRLTETGLTDYQRKVWHSPKPRCVKQIHTDDLRVDLQTFASALYILIFGCAASLLILSMEIIQHKLWQRYHHNNEGECEEEEQQA